MQEDFDLMTPDGFFVDFDFNSLHQISSDISSNIDTCTPYESWKDKLMDQWQNEDVRNFILNEMSINRIDIDIYRFSTISGFIFKNLTEENCQHLSSSNVAGEMIYKAKEKFLRYQRNEFETNYQLNWGFKNQQLENIDYMNSCNNILENHISVKQKRPGRPKNLCPVKLRRKGEKLWEFLINLLNNVETCPQLIKWENFEEGTFKFVQPEKVARIWGSRKNNEKMTYEKFSRAMRYYYKSQVLLPVRGRKLIYQFGPYAKDWKNVAPRLLKTLQQPQT